MKPVRKSPDFIAERRRRAAKKYILLTTNHDSPNFLTILPNDFLNRFPVKNPRLFHVYTLYEKTNVGSTWSSAGEGRKLLNDKMVDEPGVFIGLRGSHKL
jgi:hypothetical protein